MLNNLGLFVVVLISFIAINIVLVFRLWILNTKPKTILISVLSVNLFLLMLFSLRRIFPNENCRIDLVINNKSDQVEIIANKEINYKTSKNESLIIDDIGKGNGVITIQTFNNSKIIYYYESKHIFTFPHKIKLNITNENIEASSFLVEIFTPSLADDILNKMIDMINN